MDEKVIKTVTLTDVNQNLGDVLKLVDLGDDVIVTKNNKPAYVISKYNGSNKIDETELFIKIATMILTEHKHAFEVLGKWLDLIKIKCFYCNN